MAVVWLVAVLLCLGAGVVSPYKFYQQRIPNGAQVPHPCMKNIMWPGVGHKEFVGGGPRNQFGKDFAAANHQWTASLCQKDSDQDGVTNGQELGDPSCQWTPNSIAGAILNFRSSNLTHPGVCEPVDSAMCRAKQSYQCGGEYNCSATKAPGVKFFDIRLTNSSVPPKDTTYMCQNFKIPVGNGTDYHAIAFEPLIDNKNVMHHILIFACSKPVPTNNAGECAMQNTNCLDLVAGWTLGLEGVCLPDAVGMRFGKKLQYLAMQMHWTNTQRKTTYTDGSGMRIMYTPKLRPYDEGISMQGQQFLDIKPGSMSATTTGSCSPACTKRVLPGPIKITGAHLHMHLLGNGGRITLLRNGVKVRDLVFHRDYVYDTPEIFRFTPPVDVYPGDEIVTECNYQSAYGKRSRNTTVYWGLGTYDEMCFAFLWYYPQVPKSKFSNCVQLDKYDTCDTRPGRLGPCDYRLFGKKVSAIEGSSQLSSSCPAGVCTVDCMKYLYTILKEPCMTGGIGTFTRYGAFMKYYPKFGAVVAACDLGVRYDLYNPASPAVQPGATTLGPVSGGAQLDTSATLSGVAVLTALYQLY